MIPDERERLTLLSLLEQARAFRADIEKRLEPLLEDDCSCQFCMNLGYAVDHAEQLEAVLDWTLELSTDAIEAEQPE